MKNLLFKIIKNLQSISLSIIKRVQELRYELPAWIELYHVGGKAAVAAMYTGFTKANQYSKWNDWSLSRHSILLIACLMIKQEIKHVVEFGSGYSTVALGEFLYRMELETQMDSFEHQGQFVDQISSFIKDIETVHLHCNPLLQVDDNVFEQVFLASDPYVEFVSSATRLPEERYHETRVKNIFYEFDFHNFDDGTIDLLILDGPHGNGRSLAFPFLKNAMRFPSWVLIDDYLDYPFLDDLKRVFVTEMFYHRETDRKEFALVKLLGVKS